MNENFPINPESSNEDENAQSIHLANTDDLDALSMKQQKAIIALIQEPTVDQAAKQAKVGVRTLYRWLNDKTFSRIYRKARREAFSHAIGLTQRYAPLAVNTLVKVMADTAVASQTRVSAAAIILKFSRESLEADDLAARIEALEHAMSEEIPTTTRRIA